MKTCVNCGKPINEDETNKYREARLPGLLCDQCAAKFTAGIFNSSDDNSKPMPPEINNPNIVSWNPKEKKGMEKGTSEQK